MKRVLVLLGAASLVAGIYLGVPATAKAQITIEDVDIEAPEIGLCRCHTSGENRCLGGNLISLRPRCGNAPGCAPGGPC